MSNIIRFLESAGADPAFSRISGADYEASVDLLQADDAQRDALLARDPKALNALLGGRNKIWCSLYPPKEDQPARREEKREDREDEQDDDNSPAAPLDD
ncbi:MAG: hypothetical protein ACOH1R_09050 [Luteimonas sp.]